MGNQQACTELCYHAQKGVPQPIGGCNECPSTMNYDTDMDYQCSQVHGAAQYVAGQQGLDSYKVGKLFCNLHAECHWYDSGWQNDCIGETGWDAATNAQVATRQCNMEGLVLCGLGESCDASPYPNVLPYYNNGRCLDARAASCMEACPGYENWPCGSNICYNPRTCDCEYGDSDNFGVCMEAVTSKAIEHPLGFIAETAYSDLRYYSSVCPEAWPHSQDPETWCDNNPNLCLGDN